MDLLLESTPCSSSQAPLKGQLEDPKPESLPPRWKIPTTSNAYADNHHHSRPWASLCLISGIRNAITWL
jgi:hypothetical protein